MRIPIVLFALSLAHAAVADPTAAQRLNETGPEAQLLERDAGTWEVTATMWQAPGAKPMITKGLVAERTMVGRYLQETMKPAAGSKDPPFTRLDYLHFSRVEGRWQYVSMDTRMPVGVMPASSFDRGSEKSVTLEFAPLAFVGMGDKVEGTMMRSNLVITRDGKDHQVKEQHWVKADGSGKEWLAIRYDYRRKP
ncbi:MAG: DUF1579 family protein [Kofleriaceae bacterium]